MVNPRHQLYRVLLTLSCCECSPSFHRLPIISGITTMRWLLSDWIYPTDKQPNNSIISSTAVTYRMVTLNNALDDWTNGLTDEGTKVRVRGPV